MARAASRVGETRGLPAWLTQALTKEQRSCLRRTSRNACVFASAGSGKTRTLVHAIGHELELGTASDAIVAFTFTEKAAQELAARLHLLAAKHMPGVNLSGMFVGTIHAWCFKYLTSLPEFYDFIPLDDLHVDTLVSRLYDYLDLENTYALPFPRGIARFIADLEVFYNEHLSIEDVPPKLGPVIAKFLQTLSENRMLTFGGMVRHTTEQLSQTGPVRGLRALYVDEYQDVNSAQVELIRKALPDDARCMVVGDDLQSIYNWRGSDVRRILRFGKEFEDTSVYRLAQNYRSRPQIIVLANRIAEDIKLRHPGEMRSVRKDSAVPSVHWLSLGSEQEQALAIVSIVRNFLSEGVEPRQVAILLRSVTGSGKPIVDALSAASVPVHCPILGRSEAFVTDFLLPMFAWLKDDHHEPRSEVEEEAQLRRRDGLWESVRNWTNTPDQENAFWQCMERWRAAIETQSNDSYDVRGRLYDFLDGCGVRIGPQDHELMLGLGIVSQIIRSVEEIHRRRLARENRRSPHGVMSEVYHALLRKYHEYGESVPITTGTNGVIVTTVHQAKGLEWPVVIVPALATKRFPVASRKHTTSFGSEIATRYGTTLEDERRLFYVACTRARERLFLLDTANGKGPGSRSRFLRDLDAGKAIMPVSIKDIPQSVWRISRKDLEERDPPPLQIGLSDLIMYLECPYQFGLRAIVGVQPAVGEELGFGKSLHELIRRRHDSGRAWTDSERRRQVTTHVKVPYMSADAEVQVRRAIAARMAGLEELGAFQRVTAAEIPFNVVLDAGIVKGNVDCVLKDEDGTLSIRDWKSSIHPQFVARYELQLQFYAYALRCQNVEVVYADMVDVAASARTGHLVARPVDLGRAALERLSTRFQNAVHGIRAGDFSATPSPDSCGACDIYRICAVRWNLETSDEQ